MVAALTNPSLYMALATLITAITALVKTFQIHAQVEANAVALVKVEANTNGTLAELHSRLAGIALAEKGTPESP